MSETGAIRFRPCVERCEQALIFVLRHSRALTMPQLHWIVIRSDESHLNRYGRPVIGSGYQRSGDKEIVAELSGVVSAMADKKMLAVENDIVSSLEREDMSLDYLSESDKEALKVHTAECVLASRTPQMHPRLKNLPDGLLVGVEVLLSPERLTDETLENLAYVADMAVF